MPTALRRDSTPYIPSANRMVPRTRKWRSPGIRNSTSVLARNDDGADQGDREKQGGDLEGEHVAGEHQAADGLGGRDVEQGVAYTPRGGDHDPDGDRPDADGHGHGAEALARADQTRHVDLARRHEDGEDDQHHHRADV